jgi:hypothetical protein
MSTYSSLFEVQGKIGATTFQKRKGKLIIGKTGGVSAERIAKAKEFKRTRENNREFAGSANVAKSLRDSIADVAFRFADDYFSVRLASRFGAILRESTGTRGKRPIEIVPNKDHLVGLEMDKEKQLSSSFVAPFAVSANTDRNTATLDIPVFNYDGRLHVPEGATHWNLVLTIAAVSDHGYVTSKKKYRAQDLSLNGLSVTVESAPMDVDVPLTSAIQLVASLPGLPILPANVALVACVGVEFSQGIGTASYLFAQSNAMRVHDVF